jgi:hypothetical protein
MGISLEKLDCRSGPGRRSLIRQPALPATGEDFGSSSAGRLDQSTALVERQPPECRQLIVEQRRFWI